jgi:hypothetical protein
MTVGTEGMTMPKWAMAWADRRQKQAVSREKTNNFLAMTKYSSIKMVKMNLFMVLNGNSSILVAWKAVTSHSSGHADTRTLG